MPFLIEDARTYFNLIKGNRLKTKAEDQEAIDVLEERLTAYIEAAEGRTGRKRDAYLFFQGALMGHLIEAKKYKQNLQEQASDQKVDLTDNAASH